MGNHFPDVLDLVPSDEFRIHEILDDLDRPGQDLLMQVVLDQFVEYLVVNKEFLKLESFFLRLVGPERSNQFG